MRPFPPLTYFVLVLTGEGGPGWRLMRRENGAEFPIAEFRTIRECAREARKLQKSTGGQLSPMLATAN